MSTGEPHHSRLQWVLLPCAAHGRAARQWLQHLVAQCMGQWQLQSGKTVSRWRRMLMMTMMVHGNGRNQGRTRWNSGYATRRRRSQTREVRTSGRPNGDLSEMNLAVCPKLLGAQQTRPSWTRQSCGHQPWPNSCCARILAAHQHQLSDKKQHGDLQLPRTWSCWGTATGLHS